MERKIIMTADYREGEVFEDAVQKALDEGWEPVPGTLALVTLAPTNIGDRIVGCVIMQRPEEPAALQSSYVGVWDEPGAEEKGPDALQVSSALTTAFGICDESGIGDE